MSDQSGPSSYWEGVKARKRAIRKLAEHGTYAAEIARLLGCSRQVVAYHARVMGLALPQGRRRLQHMFRDQVETTRGFIDYPLEEPGECQPQSRL